MAVTTKSCCFALILLILLYVSTAAQCQQAGLLWYRFVAWHSLKCQIYICWSELFRRLLSEYFWIYSLKYVFFWCNCSHVKFVFLVLFHICHIIRYVFFLWSIWGRGQLQNKCRGSWPRYCGFCIGTLGVDGNFSA